MLSCVRRGGGRRSGWVQVFVARRRPRGEVQLLCGERGKNDMEFKFVLGLIYGLGRNDVYMQGLDLIGIEYWSYRVMGYRVGICYWIWVWTWV